MRKVIDELYQRGSTDIGAIKLDAKSWNDIPALLIGLQAIYTNEATPTELFRLLDAQKRRSCSRRQENAAEPKRKFDSTTELARHQYNKTGEFYFGIYIPGRKQCKHHRSNVHDLYERVRKGENWKSRPDDVRAYLDAARMIADRAQASLAMFGFSNVIVFWDRKLRSQGCG